MKIVIKVTKDILEKSKMCGVVPGGGNVPENCAIALAVREIFPNASVGMGIYLDRSEQEPSIELPEEACHFIGRFDSMPSSQRPNMDPISFEIDVPAHVIEKIGISQVYKVLSESKTLELASI